MSIAHYRKRQSAGAFTKVLAHVGSAQSQRAISYSLECMVTGTFEIAKESDVGPNGSSVRFTMMIVEPLKGKNIPGSIGRVVGDSIVYDIFETFKKPGADKTDPKERKPTGTQIRLFPGSQITVSFYLSKQDYKAQVAKFSKLRYGSFVTLTSLKPERYQSKKFPEKKGIDWKCRDVYPHDEIFDGPATTFKMVSQLPQTVFLNFIDPKDWKRISNEAEERFSVNQIAPQRDGESETDYKNRYAKEDLEIKSDKLEFIRQHFIRTYYSGILSPMVFHTRASDVNDVNDFRTLTGDPNAWIQWGVKDLDPEEEKIQSSFVFTSGKEDKQKRHPRLLLQYGFSFRYQDPNGKEHSFNYNVILNVMQKFKKMPDGVFDFIEQILGTRDLDVWEACGPKHALMMDISFFTFLSDKDMEHKGSAPNRALSSTTQEMDAGDSSFMEHPPPLLLTSSEDAGDETPSENNPSDAMVVVHRPGMLQEEDFEEVAQNMQLKDSKPDYTVHLTANGVFSGLAEYLLALGLCVSPLFACQKMKEKWTYKAPPPPGNSGGVGTTVHLFNYTVDEKTRQVIDCEHLFNPQCLEHTTAFPHVVPVEFTQSTGKRSPKDRPQGSPSSMPTAYNHGYINVGELPCEYTTNTLNKRDFRILDNSTISLDASEALSQFPLEKQWAITEALLTRIDPDETDYPEDMKAIIELGFSVPPPDQYQFIIYDLLKEDVATISLTTLPLTLDCPRVAPPLPVPIEFSRDDPVVDPIHEILTHATVPLFKDRGGDSSIHDPSSQENNNNNQVMALLDRPLARSLPQKPQQLALPSTEPLMIEMAVDDEDGMVSSKMVSRDIPVDGEDDDDDESQNWDMSQQLGSEDESVMDPMDNPPLQGGDGTDGSKLDRMAPPEQKIPKRPKKSSTRSVVPPTQKFSEEDDMDEEDDHGHSMEDHSEVSEDVGSQQLGGGDDVDTPVVAPLKEVKKLRRTIPSSSSSNKERRSSKSPQMASRTSDGTHKRPRGSSSKRDTQKPPIKKRRTTQTSDL